MQDNYTILPVDRDLIEQELNADRFVRNANKGSNLIYIVNHHNSPNVMREIGRLREITFAAAGGGTGKALDIDALDTAENCYQQLIVYDPEEREIVSGYRFIDGAKVTVDGNSAPSLSTLSYFNFSDDFIQNYLPYTIELGRSWVQPKYQPSVDSKKGLFAMDNLWDGLGAIIVDHPHMKYFFGKVTMYDNYHRQAKASLMYFMRHYFPDPDQLVRPIHALSESENTSEIAGLIEGKDFDEGYRALNQHLKAFGEYIPPLINTYMKLSATMKVFGTAVNPDFGGVEETGILVTVDDIYPIKKERHINSYLSE